MIYLPSQFGRWWKSPDIFGPKPMSRYFKRIGWWQEDLQQTTFEEYLEINAYQFERALYALIPLEDRVYEALGHRNLSQRDLEHITSSYAQDLVPRENCTMPTALRRLMKAGKITRRLKAHGWFHWYEYERLE